jgi:hypothetical protein
LGAAWPVEERDRAPALRTKTIGLGDGDTA